MNPLSLAWRLALATALAAFTLITLGGLVHNTGSSLACPDWPLCYGQWLPPMTGKVLYEHSHRLLGAVVGLGITGLMITLWSPRSLDGSGRGMKVTLLALIFFCALGGGVMLLPNINPVVAKPALWTFLSGLLILSLFALLYKPPISEFSLSAKAIGLFGLVLFQGLLGGTTVKYRLPSLVSTAHLATSMIVLLALVFIGRAAWLLSRQAGEHENFTPQSRAAFKLYVLAAALVYAQIIIGALVRHANASEAAGWGLPAAAIGIDPSLNRYAFWPASPPAQLNVFHRYFAVFAALVVTLCCARCWALLGGNLGRGRISLFVSPVILVLTQIAIGVIMLAVWNLQIYTSLNVSADSALWIQIIARTAHLSFATLLLVSLSFLAMLTC